MERDFVEMIYRKKELEMSAETRVAEKLLLLRLSALVPRDSYIEIEEDLYNVYSKIEKESFSYGFLEGVRFLMKCM